MAGASAEDVVAYRLDAVQDASAPQPGEAQLEAQLKEGPAFATVTHVERSLIGPRGDQGFHIR